MQVRNIRLSPIDNLHAAAHVEWTAVYAKDMQPDISIDFEMHYFVQELNGQQEVFGWVSGDEKALLRDRMFCHLSALISCGSINNRTHIR